MIHFLAINEHNTFFQTWSQVKLLWEFYFTFNKVFLNTKKVEICNFYYVSLCIILSLVMCHNIMLLFWSFISKYIYVCHCISSCQRHLCHIHIQICGEFYLPNLGTMHTRNPLVLLYIPLTDRWNFLFNNSFTGIPTWEIVCQQDSPLTTASFSIFG